MCWLFYKRRTGTKRTDKLLTELAIASVATGSWTALDSILIVILTTSTPSSAFLFAAPNFCFSSLYINTVLCNLNIRQFFRERDLDRDLEDTSETWRRKIWGSRSGRSLGVGTGTGIVFQSKREGSIHQIQSGIPSVSLDVSLGCFNFWKTFGVDEDADER